MSTRPFHGIIATLFVCTFALPLLAGAATVQFGSSRCNLVIDTLTKTIPNTSKPAYLQSYIDPTFGTTITRITGDVGTVIPTMGETWSDVSRPGYENRQAWNADQSLLLIERTRKGWLFLDGTTYQPLFSNNSVQGEARWDPVNPNVMDYVSSSCELGTWNPRTNATMTQKTISGYSACSMGNTGNWSNNGAMAALMATRASDSKSVIFAVDMSTGTKYPDIDTVAAGFHGADTGLAAIDWVSISPLGDLIFANGELTNGQGQNDNAKIFDLQGNTVSEWLEYGSPSHVDLSIDASGNEVAVGVAKTALQGIVPGKVIMRNMRTGFATALNTGGFATIVSARNLVLPGWAFVNMGVFTRYPPYNDEIVAVKLDGSLTVPRLAHAHMEWTDYETQGFVVPSPDGMRFVFSSDWNESSGRPVQTYVVDMRPLCSGGGDTTPPSILTNLTPPPSPQTR